MHLRVLGSSSAGNCTLIWNDQSAVMVDCGFNPRYITSCLEALDLDIPPITGVLITHAHGDHVNDLSVRMLSANGIPLVVRHEISRVLRRTYPAVAEAARKGLLREFDGTGTAVGTLEIDAFEVPHDSPGGCFGFGVACGVGPMRRRIALATDLGYPAEGLREKFLGANAVVIESNHDIDMLENSGRPAWLKKRIKEIGHLSNDQCAAFVRDLCRSNAARPSAVILAHISQQCNTNELAERATTEALLRDGVRSVRVVQSFKALPSEIVRV